MTRTGSPELDPRDRGLPRPVPVRVIDPLAPLNAALDAVIGSALAFPLSYEQAERVRLVYSTWHGLATAALRAAGIADCAKLPDDAALLYAQAEATAREGALRIGLAARRGR
jgi:hypothetical protein